MKDMKKMLLYVAWLGYMALMLILVWVMILVELLYLPLDYICVKLGVDTSNWFLSWQRLYVFGFDFLDKIRKRYDKS